MLNCELDGELYCHGMSFDQLSSILSRTVNLHDDFSKVKFHCFDIINEQPQLRRLLQIEALKGLHHYIEIAPFWICESLDEIMSVYDKLINSGYEGIIVRHKDGNYERKRSTMIMKFKPKKIDTYKVIGYEEEISIDGKPKDALGSLWCASGDGNQFSVGSGFTREQREQLWEIREELIGKEVIVSYQHLTSGKKKPRFPVFVDVLG
jgi:DNA ligase-1